VIQTLLEVARLKSLPRAGWQRKGIASPESVAGHSWGVSLLVLLLAPDTLDRERALSYAVLHDLPEIRVGDLTPHDNVEPNEKHRQERQAMAGICATLPAGGRLQALWDEYEAQETAEARFVRQLDRLDMAIQAVVYAEDGQTDVEEFLDSAEMVITLPPLVGIVHQLRQHLRSLAG
jgi:putative hydrolases of HD superfamily